jgi:tripartite-type tricarboxylate transporter receptor subunit TctC
MRSWLLMGAGCVVAAALAMQTQAAAQNYPDRSVRILIAFPAGGTIDTLGRILSQKLTELWGQNVVVENRPGAGGNIGAAAAAQAAPDGYTLHFGAQTLGVNVTLAPYQNLDPVKDFEPVVLAATATDVMVVPANSLFRTVREFIDHAKKHPGELNYGSLGVGTSSHLSTVQFADAVGIKLQHVTYTGFSQNTTDLMAGRLSMWFPTLGGSLGNIQSGKMRALAISGPVRTEVLPDVPTFKELGIEFEESSWYAFFVPRGTSKEIVGKVNQDVNRILTMQDVRAKGVTLGYRFVGGSSDKLTQFLNSEIAKWAAAAKRGSLR